MDFDVKVLELIIDDQKNMNNSSGETWIDLL